MQPITRPVVVAMVSVMPAALTACGTLMAARPRNAVSVTVASVDVFQMLTCVNVVAPVLNAAVDVHEIAPLLVALAAASKLGELIVFQVIAWRAYEPVELGSVPPTVTPDPSSSGFVVHKPAKGVVYVLVVAT
jgi:hypothetical protein